MKKIARADVRQYGIPPKHFGVNSARLQGEDESGLQSFWIGVSHYLPEGRSVVNDGTTPAVMLVVVNS